MIARHQEGIWLALDGMDGVGKSTVAQHLRGVVPQALVLLEFSSGEVGDFLLGLARRKPPQVSEGPLGEALLFLSDFVSTYERIIVPERERGGIVISDRGYLSKYVYQSVVLSCSYDRVAVRRALDAIFALIEPPDLTIYLPGDLEAIKSRLIIRDGGCEEERLDFLGLASAEFEAVIRRGQLRVEAIGEALEDDTDAVKGRAAEIVSAFIEGRWRRAYDAPAAADSPSIDSGKVGTV